MMLRFVRDCRDLYWLMRLRLCATLIWRLIIRMVGVRQDTECVEAMFRKVFPAGFKQILSNGPYTNGNWGIAVAKAQLSFGVF